MMPLSPYASSPHALTPPPSGASPAGRGPEHHGSGPPAAAGGPRDGGGVHDLRQPLGGAQDPRGVPPAGAAAAPPAAAPPVLRRAGGNGRRPRLHRGHRVRVRPAAECLGPLWPTRVLQGPVLLPRTNKALADSLDRAVDPLDPLVNRLLRIMATAAMSQAEYFSTGLQAQDHFYHYGAPSGRRPLLKG